MSATSIKWRTSGWSNEIKPIEVVRETDASVFIAKEIRGTKPRIEERREAKHSESAQYHDAWEDARGYLLSRAEAKVIAMRRSLELANAELGNIKGMKPPQEPQK